MFSGTRNFNGFILCFHYVLCSGSLATVVVFFFVVWSSGFLACLCLLRFYVFACLWVLSWRMCRCAFAVLLLCCGAIWGENVWCVL